MADVFHALEIGYWLNSCTISRRQSLGDPSTDRYISVPNAITLSNEVSAFEILGTPIRQAVSRETSPESSTHWI